MIFFKSKERHICEPPKLMLEVPKIFKHYSALTQSVLKSYLYSVTVSLVVWNKFCSMFYQTALWIGWHLKWNPRNIDCEVEFWNQVQTFQGFWNLLKMPLQGHLSVKTGPCCKRCQMKLDIISFQFLGSGINKKKGVNTFLLF